MHIHSPNGVAVSAQKNGLLPISQQSTIVLSSLAYHDYEGIALNEAEKPRLVRDLGDKNFLMLRNHGLLTVGPTIADAFLFMYTFEVSCMIQVRAQSGGNELIPIDKPILDGSLSPGGGEKMSKQVVRGGDVAELLEALCATSRESAGEDGEGLPVRRHSGGWPRRILDRSRAAE